MQKLNVAAKRCFIPGKELSFGEGGIPSRSCYNTVRQYNNSKPDKNRIDFFTLANASSAHNFIIHRDIYEGKLGKGVHPKRDMESSDNTKSCCELYHSNIIG